MDELKELEKSLKKEKIDKKQQKKKEIDDILKAFGQYLEIIYKNAHAKEKKQIKARINRTLEGKTLELALKGLDLIENPQQIDDISENRIASLNLKERIANIAIEAEEETKKEHLSLKNLEVL